MLTEKWKPIKNYEGLYEVSNTGKVRSVTREVKTTNGRIAHFLEINSKTSESNVSCRTLEEQPTQGFHDTPACR